MRARRAWALALSCALLGVVVGALTERHRAAEREDELLRAVERLSARVWALEADRRGRE